MSDDDFVDSFVVYFSACGGRMGGVNGLFFTIILSIIHVFSRELCKVSNFNLLVTLFVY